MAKLRGIYYFSNPMAKLEAGTTLKRLRNRYRLLVMNDDTYEEVVTFKLSRLSVYIMLCSIFVLLVGLTVALMVFTDIKYYLPGNDEVKKVAIYLRQHNFDVRAILYPAVPKGQERLRLVFHAFNTTGEVEELIALLT